MDIEDGKIILAPISKPKSLKALGKGIDLKSLASKVTADNRPDVGEFDDAPVGREVW
jgi:hypothetical protein